MTLPIFLVTRFQAVDANGAPLSGALLYFYTAGTTTPITVYQDAGMATPHANPVVADATGTFAPIYVNDTLLKTVLKTSAGVTVQTVDNIPGLSNLGLQIAGFTGKTTPVDADGLLLSDSADGNSPKELTWGHARDALFVDPGLLNAVFDNVKSATGHLFGLTLSNDSGTPNTKLDIAAGTCRDSTDTDFMILAAIVKSTSSWAVGTGSGALDGGSISNSTWYHVFVIKRVDTNVVDVLFSTSPTSPTLPTNYTLFRRIGAFKTDTSAHIVAFTQTGDQFLWSVPIIDVVAANPGTSAVTRTLSVPTGVTVLANIIFTMFNASNGGVAGALLTALSQADTTATLTAYSQIGGVQAASGSTNIAATTVLILTNTSAQIRSRVSYSDASVQLVILTFGWVDQRGRVG